MSKKILIVGTSQVKSELLIHSMKEKYGDDIILYTPEEAREQGLNTEDFANIPRMKITAPPEIPMVEWNYKSGKEKRRERRAKERKNNKKWK